MTEPKNSKNNTGVKKPTRTVSGVAPVAVMIPPRQCEHGTCLFCPTLNAPQSYTPESPAVLRAKSLEYDPYRQVQTRVKMLNDMGHPTNKVELIIMGGTFLSFDRDFQFKFIKRCYDGLNGKTSKTLTQAKKFNETAKNRCTALCIETRPDVCTEQHIQDILEFGATRVELGVQAIDDKIYKKVNRGHTVQDVIDTTYRLKQAGFKIGYHLMPGIPGSTPKKDLQMFKKIFKSSKYKPDQIKIYPCQVLKGAELEDSYWRGNYIPYTKQQVSSLVIKMLKKTPRYCRIMRIMREIPPSFLIAGVKNIDMRKDIEEVIRAKGTKINEIRFREIGFAIRDSRKVNTKIKIKTTKYKANQGTEYFIEAVNKDNLLFGLIRLRLEKNKDAIIRELHVYGPALNLGEKHNEKWQHKGLGKILLEYAEQIAKKKKNSIIKIISGIGVREYYRKLGYKIDKDNIYVEKEL
jgi:elongator complex protein 3